MRKIKIYLHCDSCYKAYEVNSDNKPIDCTKCRSDHTWFRKIEIKKGIDKMIDTIKAEIDNLKNQIKDIEQTIRLKEEKLNELRLQENKYWSLHLYFDAPNNKRIRQIINIFEKSFDIKFELKEKLFTIQEAKFFDMTFERCLKKIEVHSKYFNISFEGAFINENIKDILNKITECLRQVKGSSKYIGIAGLKGLIVPEIENSNINFIKID